MQLDVLFDEARACTICAADLPLGPRPLLQGSSTSRLLVIGQAPGEAAHDRGVPWEDRSGDRLRAWLDIEAAVFYDADRVALLPMGFCFPGKSDRGDLAPRPECAEAWHDRFLRLFENVQLTIVLGRYAFDRYLSGQFRTITAAVAAYDDLLPDRIALPHPSPRNNRWLAKHPWFEREVLPALRRRVRDALR